MKKQFVLSVFSIIFTLCVSSVPSLAEISSDKIELDSTIKTAEVDYISPSDYLQKYGEENVNEGFNTVENSLGLKTAACNDSDTNGIDSDENNDQNDLFLSLKEGTFLGQKIISVSDVSPYDQSFSLRIKDNMPSPKTASGNEQMMNNTLSSTGNHIRSYTNYDVYYSDNEPQYSTDLQNYAYEPLAGSYLYKYSYSFERNYLCSMDVEFSNTQIGCGSENNCVYTYIAAISNSQTIDFGLMANASDNCRNKGMYAFHNPGENGVLEAEGFPKVAATSYGNNMMTLENKTVTIRLSVGDSSNPGEVEMYMGSGGSCIFYKIKDDIYTSSLISGDSSRALTFLEGVSCVRFDNQNTSLTSGSYYRNVKLKNSCLYSFDSGSSRAFNLYGTHTYYTFVCKPSKISLNYGTSYEKISINYN